MIGECTALLMRSFDCLAHCCCPYLALTLHVFIQCFPYRLGCQTLSTLNPAPIVLTTDRAARPRPAAVRPALAQASAALPILAASPSFALISARMILMAGSMIARSCGLSSRPATCTLRFEQKSSPISRNLMAPFGPTEMVEPEAKASPNETADLKIYRLRVRPGLRVRSAPSPWSR
jgi:hypothetical protein